MKYIASEVLKITLNAHLSLITNIIDLFFENGYFPDHLKLAGFIPILNKNDSQ